MSAPVSIDALERYRSTLAALALPYDLTDADDRASYRQTVGRTYTATKVARLRLVVLALTGEMPPVSRPSVLRRLADWHIQHGGEGS